MSIEGIKNTEAIEALDGLSIDGKLNELAKFSDEFTLEKLGFNELLPKLEAKQTFTATSMIENICKRNPEASKILSLPYLG